MNIAQYLKRGGADLPSVITQVNAEVGLRAGDVLLAVGSLAENMGTSRSDLDLLLITDRPKNKLPAVNHLPVIVGGCLMDVQLWRMAEFEDLLAQFQAWAQTPWQVSHAVNFNVEARSLLHRLIHCRVLKEDKQERIMKGLPSRRDLARLKLHVARHLSRTVQVDMAGYREVGEYETLMFAAQELLGHATDALLAGYEMTNALAKWRSRLLGLLPADWDRSLGIRPTGLTAQQHVWNLHRAPERPDKKSVLEHAFRITTFARVAFLWAELRLVQNSIKTELTKWHRVPMSPRAAKLPCLDFDVDFFMGDDRFFLARLNEFAEPIEVSPREFRLALLFDGKTTISEAQKIGAGIEKLATRIGRAGLTVSLDSK